MQDMNGQFLAILKLIILILILLLTPSLNATIIFSETFETDGNGSRYITSSPEFTDRAGDYFTRTNGTNISSNAEYFGADGYYFAAQDINSEFPFADTSQLSFFNIDVSGFGNLSFSVGIAEDDDRQNQDWDRDTSVLFEYRIDGGSFQNLLAFTAFGNTNTEPGQDTDLDGIADGLALTDHFSSFSSSIPQIGSLLDIRVSFNNLDAGDEDIAIDSLLLLGDKRNSNITTVNEPLGLILGSLVLAILLTNRRLYTPC